MEVMPWYALILYSIPESIILVTIGAALYGYDVKNNKKRLALLGLSLALTTELARLLPIGMNAIAEIPVFIFLTSRCLRVSIKNSIFIILTSFIIIALTESLIYPTMNAVTGWNDKYILGHLGTRFFVSFLILLLIGFMAIIVVKKKITIYKALDTVKSIPNSHRRTTLLALIILFQAFVAGVLQTLSMVSKSRVWPLMVSQTVLERIIGVSLVTIPVVSFVLMRRLFKSNELEAIAKTQEAYLENMESLLTTVRAQRHDFLNHVQVLSGMLQIKQFNEMDIYMNNLLGEIRKVNQIIRINNPVLSALFNAKLALADSKHIQLEININATLKGSRLKPYEFVKIFGNLIDNALEAVEVAPPEERLVKADLSRIENNIFFEVHNRIPVIPVELLEKIFESGFSTKKDHTGIGLAAVKSLVHKYGGQVLITSTESEGTRLKVLIPCV